VTLAARIPPGLDPAARPLRRGRRADGFASGDRAPRAGWRAWLARAIVLALAATVLLSPWWAPRALSRMEFFRVRQVEIVGARFLADSDVMARLGLDTSSSVWTDLGALERRLARHPQVASVEVTRRLPGTLSVRVTENAPVALVPAGGTMRAVDSAGRSLPIDPTRVPLDLPVAAQRDGALLRMLADVRARDRAMFARISDARRGAGDEIVLTLVRVGAESGASDSVPPAPLVVRARVGITPARLGEVWAVEADLSRRGVRAAELDLRYRDQVVARLQ